jgi:hypothetical protein
VLVILVCCGVCVCVCARAMLCATEAQKKKTRMTKTLPYHGRDGWFDEFSRSLTFPCDLSFLEPTFFFFFFFFFAVQHLLFFGPVCVKRVLCVVTLFA